MLTKVDKLLNIAHQLSELKDKTHGESKVMAAVSKKACIGFFERILQVCNDLELPTCAEMTERLLEEQKTGAEITGDQLAQGVLVLENVLSAELSSVVFFRISRANQSRFEQKEPLFGVQVDTAFPSAAYDISEIGKCLALGRSTAAVFHCMKPMEVALNALAKDVKATMPPVLQWGFIEQAIKNTFPNGKVTDAFVNEALTLFSGVRTAWRNEVMHVAGKYTEEEAEVIFITVKYFMRHLATKLRE